MEIICENCSKKIKRRRQQGVDLCYPCHQQAVINQKEAWREILEFFHNQGAHIAVAILRGQAEGT